MKTIIVGLLSVGLVAVSADTSDAASKKYRRSYESYRVIHQPHHANGEMRGRIITPVTTTRRTATLFPSVARAGGR
jgi:hypothetical protein